MVVVVVVLVWWWCNPYIPPWPAGVVVGFPPLQLHPPPQGLTAPAGKYRQIQANTGKYKKIQKIQEMHEIQGNAVYAGVSVGCAYVVSGQAALCAAADTTGLGP